MKTKKAIILTYAPVSESERKLLKDTKIFKIALNQHAEEYNPDIRICTDWNLKYLCDNFPQKIISIRDRFRSFSSRVEYPDIEFKGATIICAIEWLIQKDYNNILIVGDNMVNTKEFQDNVNEHINELLQHVSIWQYTIGNFPLPIKSIKEFLNAKDVGFWDKDGIYQEDFQIIDSKEL